MPDPERPAGLTRHAKSRRGSAFLLALFILLVVSLVVFQYLHTARTGQYLSSQFERAARLRLIAESASDEMLQDLAVRCIDPGSTAGQWLLRHRNGETFALAAPRTTRELVGTFLGGTVANISGEARLFDFRAGDQDRHAYHSGEGVGRLMLTTSVSWRSKASESPQIWRLVRLHDFKISSAVAARNNFQPRPGYVHNYLLDYIFFLKDGCKAFWDKGGDLVNAEPPKIRLSQEGISSLDGLGKVFLGHPPAGAGGLDYLFVNIAPAFSGLLPRYGSGAAGQPGRREIEAEDCFRLLPKLKKLNIAGVLDRLKGVFEYSFEPITDQYPGDENGGKGEAVRILRRTAENRADANTHPGLAVISLDPALAANPERGQAILEGPVRQRFLCYVRFILDLSQIDPFVAAELEKRKDSRFLCTPPDGGEADPDVREFLGNLQEFVREKQRPNELNPYVSHFESGFLYKGGLSESAFQNPTSYPLPRFYDCRGNSVEFLPGQAHPQQSFPYNHINLLTRRHWNIQSLESQGILDRANRVLNLHGIDEVWEPLILDDDGGRPWIIKGQGALVVNGNITIRSGLRKEGREDFCILFAKKAALTIATPQRIEAALIALGAPDRGIIVSRDTTRFEVFGLLAAESLRFENPAPQESSLAYDPLFKSTRDHYWINISPKIYFQRLVTGDL